MALKAVMDAVETRFGSTWQSVDTTVIPVLYPNDGKQPPADGSAFWSVQYPVANSEQMSIGSPGANLWRETGAIRFILETKRDEGLVLAQAWCGEVAALFRGKQFASVNTWAPTSPVIDDSNDNGNYMRLSFVVPYYFDFIG